MFILIILTVIVLYKFCEYGKTYAINSQFLPHCFSVMFFLHNVFIVLLYKRFQEPQLINHLAPIYIS